jgi:hypothetical protein
MVKNAKKELDKIEEFVNKPKKKVVKVTPEMIKIIKAEPEKILPSEFKGYTTEVTKYRINWIGVFRKIQRFASGFVIVKISKSDVKQYWNEYCTWWKQFENTCNKFWHKFKKWIYRIYVEKYFNYNDWVKYCIWWRSKKW